MQAKTGCSGELPVCTLMSPSLPRFTGSADWLDPDFAAGLAAGQDLESQFLISVADFLFAPWATFWGCHGVTRVLGVSWLAGCSPSSVIESSS